jgi:hypothetical protein
MAGKSITTTSGAIDDLALGTIITYHLNIDDAEQEIM